MKISCVIPLYNAEKYIIETLTSLINQTYALNEILVIDDCGTDESAKLVADYSTNHPTVRLIKQTHNQGGSAARNRGLAESRNEWVLMMDADDTIHPDLLKLQITKLKEYKHVQPEPVAVHSAYIQTNAEGCIIEKSEYRGQQLSFEETFGTLLVRNYIITPSGLLLNRKAALDIGGYKTTLYVSEDAEFILRLSRKGTFIYVDEPYVYFRRHSMSITSDLKRASQAGSAILEMYSIEEIRDAIFKRNFPKEQNFLDFITLLYQFNQYDKGFSYLSELQSSEYQVSKHFLTSLYYLEKHQYSEAKNCLETLLKLNEAHGAALNNIGVLFAIEGEFGKARESFSSAISYYPGYMDAAHNMQQLVIEDQKEATYRFTKRELRKHLLRYS